MESLAIKHRKLLIGSMLLLGAIQYSAEVYAQGVDYTGLEAVFGEAITFSATGKPQRISDTPVSMEIINAEEIRRSGALDIPQILQRLAGVDVVRSFRGQADVSIRGYNQPLSNRLLVLVDGRQVYMDNYGVTLWNTIPVQLSEIKQIEVVRGPNTSLFGFNAEQGVINIITYNPLYDNVNVAEGRAGTQEGYAGSLVKSVKSENGRWGARFSGGLEHANDYSRTHYPYPTDNENALVQRSLNGSGIYRFSDGASLWLSAGGNNQITDNIMPTYLPFTIKTRTRHLDAKYIQDAGSKGLWTARLYRNQVAMDIDFYRFGNDLTEPKNLNILNVLQLSDLFSPAPAHSVRLGAEFRNNNLDGHAIGSGEGQYNMNIYSATGMWDWRLSDALSFTNSLRLDYWSTDRKGGLNTLDDFYGLTAQDTERNNTEYSFNSGLLYKTKQDSYYRLSVGRGLHIPSLIELGESNGNNLELYGNPYLKTESNTTYELSYGKKILNRKVDFSTSLYYEELRNLIGWAVLPPAVLGGNGGSLPDMTLFTMGDSNTIGWEAGLKGKALQNAFSWYGNYTYLISNDQRLNLPDHYLDYRTMQPRHKINVGLGYTIGNWELDADAHYVDGTRYDVSTIDLLSVRKTGEMNDYITLNSRIGYKLSESSTFSLDGYNLLDSHYEALSFTNSMTGTALGANRIGRTAMLSFRHTF